MIESPDIDALEPIAIVGMACRFPGAPDVATFWRNLREGVESIRLFSDEELRAAGVKPELFEQPGYVPAHGRMDGIEAFDAEFFGISPSDAAIMDPQHRVFLECAWEAIEHAGYNPKLVGERFGVVAGAGLNTYLLHNILARSDIATVANFYALFVANDKDFLPTRVSYKLNLRGPSLNVNTACSSSLVAVHVACQMLWSFQCDGALAGGVSLQVPQDAGYLHQQGGIASPDGRCRAFDAAANGTVTGSGAGAVVLKRLSDAQAAGDTIHALILGSAINNDGALKAGYTAPGVEGQAAVIAEAAAMAGVQAESISYVEAHGTGTSLGDPIEIAALTQAFGVESGRQFCRIGSVKTNIGHLDAAAGVAGLIKTALSLQHEAIPPTLHFRTPNPKIDFAASPFRVCAELAPWPRTETPRRAGVSSFGIGGTNAHAVLQESPAAPVLPSRPGPRLFVISARSRDALDRALRRLADHLESTDARLEDVAWTLATGRELFRHAAFVVAASRDELVRTLRSGAHARGERPAASPAKRANAANPTELGQQWLGGAEIDWVPLFAGDRPRRVPLPTYPFEPTRHWIEPGAARSASSDAAAAAPDLVRQPLADWFYVPSWTKAPPLIRAGAGAFAGNWLVCARDDEFDRSIAAELRRAGASVTVASPAQGRDEAALGALFAQLQTTGEFPDRIVSCWTLDAGDKAGNDADSDAGSVSAIQRLMRALSRTGRSVGEIAIIASGLADVHGSEALNPRAAVLLGPVMVIPDEFPGTACRCIDAGDLFAARRAADIVRELGHPVQAPLTAWRGQSRWLPCFETTSLPALGAGAEPFRKNGTYLITGGVGGLGLILAEHLATTASANVILTTRRSVPPDHAWEALALSVSRPLRRSSLDLHLPDLEADIARLERGIERSLNIQSVDDRPGLLDAGNALAAAHALEYLKSCGAFVPGETRTTRARIYDASQTLPEFRRLVDHLLNVLQDDGWIELDDDVVHIVKDVQAASSSAKLGTIASARYPGMAPEFDALAICLRGYPDAISGRVPAVSVLFPDGGRGVIVEAAERTDEHKNNRVYRTLLAETIRDLAARNPGRPLRILEVGGGNAILAGVMAERLHDMNVEYVFTDIGKSFVMAAEAKARERGYAFMTFATFDISRDPAPQGFEPGSFDAVIGLDVVHATSSVRDTVSNLRTLLAEGGLLGLVESSRTFRWNDMMFGLAEGWWYSQDTALRNPASPLLSTDRWEMALAGSGFSSVLAFPRDADARARTDCSLILAQEPVSAGATADAGGIDPRTLAALVRIRERAASLQVVQVDVADESGMEHVVAEAERRFGRIDGVIHAAAVEFKALMLSRDRRVEDVEFRPKVDGTLVLDRVFHDRPLDFMVLCSSITAVVGGAGQVGYCGANAFLDAFAGARSREREELTVSINWGRWQGVGLARDFEDWHSARTGRALLGGMTHDEGIEALRRILHHRIGPRVAVMTQEWRPERLTTRVPTWTSKDDLAVAQPPAVGAVTAVTDFDGTTIEQQLAGIWRQILGTSAFDRATTFQELGGDSLVGIQMIARIREQLGVQLPIHAVFDCPTIAALSGRIVAARALETGAIGEMEEGSL